ncbi:MAG: basic amino acid ABC transporter substrate-binding protein [candidate division Zixibacteria bacterium]|nr:basic amino acid ABC transporter substrate-binding protein [candidate division Zixibacteria bacterium]
MNKIFICMTVVLLLTGCTSEKQPDISERKVLRIGSDATYPPFETVNTATGEPEGFDIDLISCICELNGWKPEIIVTPFDGMIPGLNNRKFDVAISSMTITPQRMAVVSFSEPYYRAGQIVAVPVGDTYIKSVDDLRGKRVGVQLGTTGEIMAKKFDGVHVYSYDNIGAAFIDMANGNLDAVLNDFPTTLTYIEQNRAAKTVGELLSTEHYGIAVRKKDKALLEKINEALRTMKADGSYEAIYMKWFNTPPLAEFMGDTVAVGDTTGESSL